jgi:hypothetical protein
MTTSRSPEAATDVAQELAVQLQPVLQCSLQSFGWVRQAANSLSDLARVGDGRDDRKLRQRICQRPARRRRRQGSWIPPLANDVQKLRIQCNLKMQIKRQRSKAFKR